MASEQQEAREAVAALAAGASRPLQNGGTFSDQGARSVACGLAAIAWALVALAEIATNKREGG